MQRPRRLSSAITTGSKSHTHFNANLPARRHATDAAVTRAAARAAGNTHMVTVTSTSCHSVTGEAIQMLFAAEGF
jgi:hypothetical protein